MVLKVRHEAIINKLSIFGKKMSGNTYGHRRNRTQQTTSTTTRAADQLQCSNLHQILPRRKSERCVQADRMNITEELWFEGDTLHRSQKSWNVLLTLYHPFRPGEFDHHSHILRKHLEIKKIAWILVWDWKSNASTHGLAWWSSKVCHWLG